jgi:hypothetical protein
MLGMNNVEADRVPPRRPRAALTGASPTICIAREPCRNVMTALPSSYGRLLRNLNVLDAG